MRAFQNFKEIEKLGSVVEQHKAWLKDYVGLNYSPAFNGKHTRKYSQEKLRYKDFSTDINCIARLPNRTIIEFDDENAKENLEKVYNKLKENKWGFIRSSHKGRCDYLWIEFNREMRDNEIRNFLKWICPEGAEIDMNFSSSKRIFPVLYTIHWKHSDNREMPIEYFEGEQIDYDSLNLDENKDKTTFTKKSGYIYHTFKKASTLFTKEGQVEEFNKIQPLFYDKAGLWWLWDNKTKCWEIVDEVDILNMIKETTGEDTISSKNRTEILNGLKQIGRKNLPKPIKKTWIQFKEKIVDFVTGEQIEATPEYFVTNPIPHSLNNNNYESTPVMDKIFEEWVGEDYIKTLYEILAYCLVPDYPIHRLFCLIGAGSNGKGCFLRLIEKFVGNHNISSTELDTLLSSRFEVTRLHKKLVCVMGETNFSELSKTSIIKKLTGQDIIGFEYKNKNPFEDHNYAKIIIATNNLPTTTDKTIGFYRRWCIIDFPNQFSEEKDILNEIPNEEYESLALKCTGILKDLLKIRKFHNEGSIEERMEKYENRSNPIKIFLESKYNKDINGNVLFHNFSEDLNEYFADKGHRLLTAPTISKLLRNEGFEIKTKTILGVNGKYILGIKNKYKKIT